MSTRKEVETVKLEKVRDILKEIVENFDEKTVTETNAEGYLRVIKSLSETALEIVEMELRLEGKKHGDAQGVAEARYC